MHFRDRKCVVGYPPDALEVEAFQLALPDLATIERLIVSAQKRLDKFLDDLERTSKASARALRLAAEKAIAANKSDQSQADEVSKWYRNGRSWRTGAMARKVVAHEVRKAKSVRG